MRAKVGEARSRTPSRTRASADRAGPDGRRLATLLHRDVGSGLAAAILDLSVLRTERPRALAASAPEVLDRVLGVLDACARVVRDVELTLRPPLLEEAGLGPPLRWLADRDRARGTIDVQIDEPAPRLSSEAEWRLYRAAEVLVTRGLRGRRLVSLKQTARATVLSISGAPARELPDALLVCRGQVSGVGRAAHRLRPFQWTIRVRPQKSLRIRDLRREWT